jgi:hypothetical protein
VYDCSTQDNVLERCQSQLSRLIFFGEATRVDVLSCECIRGWIDAAILDHLYFRLETNAHLSNFHIILVHIRDEKQTLDITQNFVFILLQIQCCAANFGFFMRIWVDLRKFSKFHTFSREFTWKSVNLQMFTYFHEIYRYCSNETGIDDKQRSAQYSISRTFSQKIFNFFYKRRQHGLF